MPTETQVPIDPELIRKAQRRVSLRMGFFSHALVYVAVNAGLFALNVFQGGPLWSFWPMAGWGIGLAFQYFNAYGNSKEDLTEQEYRKLKKQSEE